MPVIYLGISKLPIFVLHCQAASNAVVLAFQIWKCQLVWGYHFRVGEKCNFSLQKNGAVNIFGSTFSPQCVDLFSSTEHVTFLFPPPQNHLPHYWKHPATTLTSNDGHKCPIKQQNCPRLNTSYERLALLIKTILPESEPNTTNVYLRKSILIIMGVRLRGLKNFSWKDS